MNIPFSFFHFRRKKTSLNAGSCSCSSSDWTRIKNKDNIGNDSSGMYGKPSSFCTNNNRFDSSTIGSLPWKCLQWSRCCEWTVSNSSRPHSWDSLISCQYWTKKRKIWNPVAETKLRTTTNHLQVFFPWGLSQVVREWAEVGSNESSRNIPIPLQPSASKSLHRRPPYIPWY